MIKKYWNISHIIIIYRSKSHLIGLCVYIVIQRDKEPEGSVSVAPIMEGMKKSILASYAMIGKMTELMRELRLKV